MIEEQQAYLYQVLIKVTSKYRVAFLLHLLYNKLLTKEGFTMNIIEIKNLSFRYKNKFIFDNI